MTAVADQPTTGTQAPHPAAQGLVGPTVVLAVGDPTVHALARTWLPADAQQVHWAPTAAAARVLARQLHPVDHVVPLPAPLAVVGTTLPDGSAQYIARELGESGWRTIVVGRAGDIGAVHTARSARARALVVVDPLPDTPAGTDDDSASDDSASGKVPDTVADRVSATPRTGRRPVGPAALSRREIQVLQLVADGRSNRDAGDVLGLSALTVKSHLARIGRKLGTGDRAELVALGMRSGLLH